MTADTTGPITTLLRRATKGDARAEEELLQALYDELHRLARLHMRRERQGHTLQPTALVNEAYVRLLRGADASWNDRHHFLNAASGAMQRVLVDHARRRTANKRGNGVAATELHDADGALQLHRPEVILTIDGLLTKLEALDARQAQIVRLRFFAGLTETEIAELLDVSSRTIKRQWVEAKAWLYERLKQ